MTTQTKLSNIEIDLLVKTQTFSEFYDKVMAPEMKTPFTAEAISGMKIITQISPMGLDLAVEQVKVLGSYLRNRLLPGSVLVSLTCGLYPTTPDDVEAESMRSLSGEHLPLHHPQVRDAAWVLRRWSNAEENIGMVDPIDFYNWADEVEISTNYLRLMRELMGCGCNHAFGVLPLGELVKYGSSF
jgi:hypothetical protein